MKRSMLLLEMAHLMLRIRALIMSLLCVYLFTVLYHNVTDYVALACLEPWMGAVLFEFVHILDSYLPL